MAAQSLGFRVLVLDPATDSPAGSVADRHLPADYLDPPALAALRALCVAATTEFENVPAAALEFLAREFRVTPGAASVAIAQDRINEKTFLAATVARRALRFCLPRCRRDRRCVATRHRQSAALRRQGQGPREDVTM